VGEVAGGPQADMSDGAGALAQAPPALEADGTFVGMAPDGVMLPEPAPHPAASAATAASAMTGTNRADGAGCRGMARSVAGKPAERRG
jgi:hypothetical protein